MALSSEVTKVKIDGAKIRSGRYAALSTEDDEGMDSHDADGCSSGGEGGMKANGNAESRLGPRGSLDGGTEDDDAILNQAMAVAAAERALYEAELDGKAAVGGDKVSNGNFQQALNDKVSYGDFQQALSDKVSSGDFQQALNDMVSNGDFQQALNGKVSNGEFQQALHDKVLSHSARLGTQDSDGLEGEPYELEAQKLQQKYDLLRAKELELDQLTAESEELQQQCDLLKLKAKELEHDQHPKNRGKGPEAKRGRAAARRRGT